MALGILDEGDRPLMLKNQTYAAAWEPYAMALSFFAFGISRIAAKLPALLSSLALIGTTWLLAREVAGRSAAWFAAALAVAPPIYVLVLSLKPWAPYTEVMLLGSLALLCAVRVAWPPRNLRSVPWALACGVTGGLAVWMHPLAVWYLTAAGVTLLARVRGRRLVRVATCGVLGFALGALPVWLYNLQTSGATLRFVLAGTQRQTADVSAGDALDVFVGRQRIPMRVRAVERGIGVECADRVPVATACRHLAVHGFRSQCGHGIQPHCRSPV